MDDLTQEENEKQGKAVYEIGVWCQACEHHIGELDDDYHKEEFDKLIKKCKNLLSGLSDPFYAGAGRHSIINVLVKAGLINEAGYLLAEVKETFIREAILEDNPSLP
ncbi:MAG: hypothetical protein KKH74_13605 [Gammaproteobacteria bacterium]|nr:hypothetical protein [Gammaproteobacteria bacterium]MBU1732821.1 hypothetical protein [Gammaproteobacteria bacterium]MBU1891646.1 hypothetical protein [Gammaproteobacteria bacterium]